MASILLGAARHFASRAARAFCFVCPVCPRRDDRQRTRRRTLFKRGRRERSAKSRFDAARTGYAHAQASRADRETSERSPGPGCFRRCCFH
jgi:hypothetical protein